MKRFPSFCCACALLSLLPAFDSTAQKKVLDHDVYDAWQRLSRPVISPDGNVIAYEVNPQEGDGVLVLRKVQGGEEIEIRRGSGIVISSDSKWASLKLKAPYQDIRKAKIAKKKADQMPKDSLICINLDSFAMDTIVGQTAFKHFRQASLLIIDSKTPKPDEEKISIVYNPATRHRDTLRRVERYSFCNTGDKLGVVFGKDKKDSLSKAEVAIFRLPSMERTDIAKGCEFYSAPEFSIDGEHFAILSSNDTNKTGSRICDKMIIGSDKLSSKAKKATRIISSEELEISSPLKGRVVSTTSSMRFSWAGSRIFVDLVDYRPPHNEDLVDFETAGLDLWSWDIYTTPPMYKAEDFKPSPCVSALNLAGDRKLHAISTSEFERIGYCCGNEGGYALVCDSKPYAISSTWDQNRCSDVYLADLNDGSRKLVRKGLDAMVSISPEGKYLYWFSADDLGWHVLDIAKDTEVNVTAQTAVEFYDREDDHPYTKPATDSPHWLEGDAGFLLSDMHDLWFFSPDGRKAENLTKGEARRMNRQYKFLDLTTQSDKHRMEEAAGRRGRIGKKDQVYMSIFDRNTKEYGYACMLPDGKEFASFVEPKTYNNFIKAEEAEVFAYAKGDVKNSDDVYLRMGFSGSEEKLSATNPQQAEYNWCDVQLVKWKAYDGTLLNGLLFTPEDLDPTKKYPMLIYFYEKSSDKLFQYRSPSPSRSIINIPFFASRGYVVFVPDIVYKTGHPGESAYNCICSGAEAMCEQFSFIDKSKMGIQGQSWGGYQTAYLITRTDMFAAAGSGAPVGNMTSAYGGIRWGSGSVRARQYEHGQSRIGKSLWDEGGLELYIENSPVFHADKVKTPVLIMHNDKDGAVPWYQGIEFFMALRRFSSPAWMLEYNDEEHNLVQRRNCKDLSIRLQQFFDHYLKGEAMPAWMKTGIPGNLKGEYFGFEQAEE